MKHRHNRKTHILVKTRILKLYLQQLEHFLDTVKERKDVINNDKIKIDNYSK